MLNLKEANNTIKNVEFNHVLTIKEIENWYLSAAKNDLNLGVEYERLSLDVETYKNASYLKMKQIISSFCDLTSWQIDYDNETIELLKEYSKNKKVIAIGEIGLDYHYENFDKVKQKEVFISQLKLAHLIRG